MKGYGVTVELIVSFPDEIEVSSGHLKGFNESLIDPKCLLKAGGTSYCFDNNLSFSSNIIYFFILISKIVWNYNQHLDSQSTAIWLVYSDLLPGFVVA